MTKYIDDLEPNEWPLYAHITCRGRKASVAVASDASVDWKRLPVPPHRRVWALLTGRHHWVFEGWPHGGVAE